MSLAFLAEIIEAIKGIIFFRNAAREDEKMRLEVEKLRLEVARMKAENERALGAELQARMLRLKVEELRGEIERLKGSQTDKPLIKADVTLKQIIEFTPRVQFQPAAAKKVQPQPATKVREARESTRPGAAARFMALLIILLIFSATAFLLAKAVLR